MADAELVLALLPRVALDSAVRQHHLHVLYFYVSRI